MRFAHLQHARKGTSALEALRVPARAQTLPDALVRVPSQGVLHAAERCLCARPTRGTALALKGTYAPARGTARMCPQGALHARPQGVLRTHTGKGALHVRACKGAHRVLSRP